MKTRKRNFFEEISMEEQLNMNQMSLLYGGDDDDNGDEDEKQQPPPNI